MSLIVLVFNNSIINTKIHPSSRSPNPQIISSSENRSEYSLSKVPRHRALAFLIRCCHGTCFTAACEHLQGSADLEIPGQSSPTTTNHRQSSPCARATSATSAHLPTTPGSLGGHSRATPIPSSPLHPPSIHVNVLFDRCASITLSHLCL
jgi:hypothetical protein